MLKGFDYLRSVLTSAVDFRSLETALIQNIPKFLRGLYKRQKHDCFALPAVLYHLVGNLIQIRIQGVVDIGRLEISVLHCNSRQVEIQRNCKSLYRRKITVLDSLRKCVFIGKRIKI